MTEHVIGIDPGLDGVGMAWLARRGSEIMVRDRLTVRSGPELAMGVRLQHIASLVEATIHEWRARARSEAASEALTHFAVVVEVPTNPGRSDHAKKAGRENVNARSMMAFWQALGAIRAAVANAGAPVVDLPPGGIRKDARQALFARWTVAGRNADERDAIVIACVHLFATASTADLARATARR